jgi:predicted butyrate kinase (DUF1464 family)
VPRVIGIDPGTISIDVCGLDNGSVFLDRSLPTADALAHPATLIELLEGAAPLDLVAGPSGYGLPLTAARDVTESDLRLACLAAEGDAGGIGGLRSLMRTLARLSMPVVLTPGVIHLASVPPHRKVNRVDMGTADKVCAVVLAIHQQAQRHACRPSDVSFILAETGGAFTAVVAVEHGRILDGLGGTSGPIGARSSGAWDGEVAFLAGQVSKDMLFSGGVAAMGETPTAWQAYDEGIVKAIASLTVSAPAARTVLLSGRHAAAIQTRLEQRPEMANRPIVLLAGFAAEAKQGAQGAALLADGLAGGDSAEIIETLGIRDARGSVLDHLYVISPAEARARIGLPPPTSDPRPPASDL